MTTHQDLPKAECESLFSEGFHDFPEPLNPAREDCGPYRLGWAAAAQIEELDREREAIFAKARELSGGNVGRVGFIR